MGQKPSNPRQIEAPPTTSNTYTTFSTPTTSTTSNTYTTLTTLTNSTSTSTSTSRPPEEHPPSARILPGAYLIRNKSSGTVLHLRSPLDSEIGEHCDIVGWQQETTDLEDLGRQIWWVEWDDIHGGYIFSNLNNRGVVLDVVGLKNGMLGGLYVGVGVSGGGEEKIVCARQRVRSMASQRCSRRSSVRSSSGRSSMEVVKREEVLEAGSVMSGGEGMQLAESNINDRIRSQRWVLKRSQPTSESFSIHNLLTPGIVLDLDWGKTINGTKVGLCPKTGVNHQQWNFIIPPIPSMAPPIGSWVFLVNHKSGSFLHHTDINYPPACVKLPKWDGIGEKKEFWGLHWCFVLADDRVGQPKWYIKNRLTGTMLEHWGGRRKGDSIKADSYLYTECKEWRLDLLPAGSPAEGKFKTGLWGIVNAESDCSLDHFGMKSVQAYSPGAMKDESRQWRIMEVSGPFVDFGAATLLSPPSLGPPLPSLSTSCTTLSLTTPTTPTSTSLHPLIMPSATSFINLEPTTWPFPACAPSSRDTIGHEERCFFELLSRIETQLIIPGPYSPPTSRARSGSAPTTPGSISSSRPPSPTLLPSRPRSGVLSLPKGFFDLVKSGGGNGNEKDSRGTQLLLASAPSKTTLTLITPTGTTYLSLPPLPSVNFTKKRILTSTTGWSAWELGFSPTSNTISNWNSLVESSVVRSAHRYDRYIISFYEGVKIIQELLCHYYDSQSAILATTMGGGDSGVVVLPSRLTWLVMMAATSLERVVRLRKEGLIVDNEVAGRMGWDGMGGGWREGRRVEEWVVNELERVLGGLKRVEGGCRAGVKRGAFVY